MNVFRLITVSVFTLTGKSWGLILPHGGLELGSTTTTQVAPSRPGGEAVVVGCTSLGWPAGGWARS